MGISNQAAYSIVAINWTATDSGWVSINTNGSGFDTVLAVYTSTDFSNLAAVAVDDNGGVGNGASLETFYAQAG